MMDQDTEKDWGNVRYRPVLRRHAAPGDEAGSRFVIGLVVFIAVALVYPWYSYWVHSTLMARDMQQATQAVGAEVERGVQQMQAATAQQRQRTAAQARQARIAAVDVVGATSASGGPVVIVRMGDASLDEAGETICAQAEHWLRTPVAGQTLRVQRHRGNAPALDVGRVRCR